MIKMRIVICKQCGNKINSSDATLLIEGKRKYYFCNEEEKDNFINKNKKDDTKDKCYRIIYNITNKAIPVVYSRLKELNKKYTWSDIYVALDKVNQSVEKYYKEKYTTDFAFARYIETCVNNTYDNETEKIEKPKFHIIKSKRLAISLSYIIEQEYYELDDKYNEGWKYYSFIETEKLLNALEDIKLLKEKYKDNN
jgi:YHS domain-containing protein